MKIRTNYVSNSSRSSFILDNKEDIKYFENQFFNKNAEVCGLLRFLCTYRMISPKKSGQWKSGLGRPIGDQLKKCGWSHLSPHL